MKTASREFRAHGFESVGIAKLMAALKLTHGGFYAHFEDKEALIAESSVFALDESLETMLEGLKTGGIRALLEYYLGEHHRNHPETGCPLPSLAAEVARHSYTSRASFTHKLTQVFEAIAESVPGPTPERKQEKARIMFAAMVGAISLSRAMTDPVLSKSILDSTKTTLLDFLSKD